MKLRILGNSVTAALAVALAFAMCLVPAPAAAQQTQASAVAAKPAMPSGAAAAAPLSAEEAAKAAMPSQPNPTPSTPIATDGHPDFTGLWSKYRGVITTYNGNTRSSLQPTSRAPKDEDPDNNLSVNTRIYDTVAARRADPNKPAYKPELMAKVARLDRLESKMDPAMHCKMGGFFRGGAPGQIVQGPGVVAFLYADESKGGYFRVIPIGRKHRTDEETNGLSPSYNGDSVGHWEGDTLVVDTTDFNDDTWLGIDGWFHSTDMHTVERIRRDGDMLHYQIVIEDPTVLTKPYVPPARTLRLNKTDGRIEQEQAPCMEMDQDHIVTPEHH